MEIMTGSRVFIIANKQRIREAVVRKISGDLLTLAFTDSKCAGVCLKKNRVYTSLSDAKAQVREPAPAAVTMRVTQHYPWTWA